MPEPRAGRVPASTYRLQVSADLDLFTAARLLPHLHDLGAHWVYLSPLLQAEPGSDHGYDVVRHDRVDSSRGGAEGLAAVSAEARRLGMGVLVDVVPNHVGVATPVENPWWWDLLRYGRGSAYAMAFDVDWDAGGGRLRIPVVGDDDLGRNGSIGHLSLEVGGDGEDSELRYHDNRYPVAPGTEGGSAAEVHDRQHYELVGWRTADDRLNYRRFFAVNTLAGIRVEDPEVFGQSHAEVRRWFDEGLVDGLRIDHPDGLRDPGRYLDDLAQVTGGAWTLVEKILEPGEELPTEWACAGTTGYDALADIDRVLVDPAGREDLDALSTRLRGTDQSWADLVHDTKRGVADGALQSEVRRIVRDVAGPGSLPAGLDEETARDAVAELVACFGVYRSYLPLGRAYLDAAVTEAGVRRPDLLPALHALLPALGDAAHPAALRLQQTSGMVMAKGVEDCAFYRWPRLTSLNEVGGDPSESDLSVAGFHDRMAHRQATRPEAMTASTTHDTKRGEDVRARISVLAEDPALWADALDRLAEVAPVPDPAFGSLLWQVVLGAWPAGGASAPDFRERLHAYAEKAMREAGDRTTWTAPDAAYEDAVHRAVDSVLDDAGARGVLEAVLAQVVDPGWSNALGAKLLTLTVPGVPDVYQGSELWEQSLVDPDNRRPVDHDLRTQLLQQAREGAWALTGGVDDPGVAKLHVTHSALRLRRERPELFTGYSPVSARGAGADHVLAFDRGGALSVMTRLPLGLARTGWTDTTLTVPVGVWNDVLTGRDHDVDVDSPLRLADLLGDLPVALLVRR